MERRLAAVLISDVVGYTKRMEEDTEGTVAAWSEARDSIISPSINSRDGRIVKYTGDGFLAEFNTVQTALECGIELQNKLSENSLEFRIAINLGDIIDDGVDIHGEGVNIAARLEEIAEPGGIVISGDVYNQVKNRIDAEYQDLGLQEVKNVAEPVQAYAVQIKSLTTEEIEETSVASHEKPSIAVLPFDNMSGDSEQEYFSDGITEDIITALSHLRWLNVIARNSSFTYKGQSPDIRQVADELNCRYVLEGSIRKAGNRVRINAQLLEGLSGNHIWAEKYDRELEDIFDLQDEITEAVLGAIEPSLVLAEIERAKRKHPENMDAYDLFLQGLPGLYTFDIEKNTTSLDLLHRAIDIDPTYPQALAYAAWGYEQRLTRGWPAYSDNDLETAVSLARRCIATGTEDPHALVFSGFTLVMTADDYELGVLTGKRALENNPNIGFISMMVGSIFLFGGDDLEKAEECVNLAIRLSPKDPGAHLFHMIKGLIALELGNIEEAVTSSKRSIQLFSTWDTGLIGLIAALVENNEINEAVKVADRLMRVDPETSISRVDKHLKINNLSLKNKMIEGMRKAGIVES